MIMMMMMKKSSSKINDNTGAIKPTIGFVYVESFTIIDNSIFVSEHTRGKEY
jgi:hypothetical protein